MNAKQTNRLTMYRAVQALLQTTTETSGIAALPAKLAAFNTQIAAIDELDRTQNQPTDGKIDERDELIREVIEATLEIAGLALSHADDHHLRDLAAHVRVSEGDFRRLRLTRRPGLAQQVHDAIAPIVAQLAGYGVTPATLTELQAKIDAATAVLNQPRSTVAVKKAATSAMAAAFASADGLLENHIDALLFPLRKTSPEFHATYRATRTVVEASSARASVTPESVPSASTSATITPTPTNEKLAA